MSTKLKYLAFAVITLVLLVPPASGKDFPPKKIILGFNIGRLGQGDVSAFGIRKKPDLDYGLHLDFLVTRRIYLGYSADFYHLVPVGNLSAPPQTAMDFAVRIKAGPGLRPRRVFLCPGIAVGALKVSGTKYFPDESYLSLKGFLEADYWVSGNFGLVLEYGFVCGLSHGPIRYGVNFGQMQFVRFGVAI
ncbi:exported hypothetical protein [Candidatus Zixiibacteriota bacterium]|nr:exported hypothetical protein [candidate division Zixibacteria bacterium]